ncbi:ubiquinol-cytochrome c reductase complex assembly factor 5-like [Lasioglossum baleicum]|uniref:ubiquinol-cytochrome c reductase complex assembly factor 5-like n=1 Tax=Lasioglossum baleicum TaxID=434251 RepID=UPI003FCC39BE
MAKFRLRRIVKRLADIVPFKFLGEFRFLPFCFLAGALLEYTMIHWHVGEVNFYRTYKKRRIEEAVEERLREMRTESVNA